MNNSIINGNFDIWQRGVFFPAVAHFTTTADRFVFGQSSGHAVFNISAHEDIPNNQSQYSINIEVMSPCTPHTGDEAHIRYGVEGAEATKIIAGRVVTFSFWIKSNTVGVYSLALVHPNSERTVEHSMLLNYEIFKPNTWEKKELTTDLSYAPGGWSFATATYGLKIRFSFYAGGDFTAPAGSWVTGNFVASDKCSNLANNQGNYMRISQFKLEVGETATQFSPADMPSELLKCQRYLFCLGGDEGGVIDSFGMTGTASAPADPHYSTITYPVKMCKNPIVKIIGDIATANISEPTLWRCGVNAASLKIVAAQPGRFALRANGATIMFDAEF